MQETTMKNRQTIHRRILRTLGTLVVAVTAHTATAQAIFTTVSGSQNWNVDTNWSTNPDPFPNAAGVSVRFNNPADNQTVLLNVPVTVGEIQWRHTSRNVNLSPGTAGTLTLNNNGSGVSISTTSRSAEMSSLLPVAFAEDATFTLGNSLTILGVVSAAGRALFKEGSSTLVLANAANTIGSIVVNEGALHVATGTANGGAVVTLKEGTGLRASENINYSGNTVIKGNLDFRT